MPPGPATVGNAVDIAPAGARPRPGLALPEPSPPEDYVGGERWDVALFLEDGRRVVVPCGALREGVSREIAMRVFEAVRRAVVEEVAR